MKRLAAIVAVGVLLLVACRPLPAPMPLRPPPVSRAAPATAPDSPPDLPADSEAAPEMSVPPPDMRPFVRSSPSLPPPAGPGLPPPAEPPIFPSPTPPPGGFAPGLPSGPVTNYGTGGMQQMPGAPPNPPYPPGGLMH